MTHRQEQADVGNPIPRRRIRFGSHRRLFAAVLAATVVMTATLILASPHSSTAHVRESAKKWYFSGSTTEQDNSYAKVDPVTIIFQGNGYTGYTPTMIYDELHNEVWPAMDIQTIGGVNCNGRQNMVWNNLNGNRQFDLEDLNMSDSDTCDDQTHIRLWDDSTHDGQFAAGGHTQGSWTVGSIHKEKRCVNPTPVGGTIPTPGGPIKVPKNCTHYRISTFERQARNLAAIVQNHGLGGEWCVKRKWVFLPGSAGGNGDNKHLDYSDGHLTRFMRVPYGACPSGTRDP